ncbi:MULTISPECIES: pirin family protein [Streptomyces]|uniref:Pirin-like protein n=1 Tax=Streptomyces griseus subsp. griseus (strain JCM 4626 / CBS 651.72 / NBRC 13350 / KCC S-0626 / ISP 5235) TaxID=455632 RepID=B1VRR8_STRGG|nr:MULTISPECIES: pirin family protein [Streptomyces]MYR12660.1 pirin family protein [Streptomyces sp. SID724]MYR48246.1 pirin family protein [Streptomyces sp. SID4928]MYT78168.1 pirin family protein [Streptomyces sp. SID8364]EGE40164.1 Pirin domain protein [Streptomyces sp. ACT-1]MBW3703133.1 pirin family protein [Streptomyces griseus]
MSNLDRQATPSVCGGRGFVVAEPVRELLAPRRVQLGEGTEVRRLLPNLGRRMVGAWAFVDHYGPDDIADEPGMQVPPHPHMGLQTVSWLHEGEVLHRDSLGSLQTVRPRELGLMTSGRAISHSEESPKEHARLLHGAQLWVALPEAHRNIEPHFQHHTDLPVVTAPGVTATVILGELDGAASPGTAYTPIVGADMALAGGAEARLPLDPDFEYAVLSMSGEAEVDGVPVLPGSMLYLGCGRTELPLRGVSDAGLMLLGGEPFEEELVMFWNFIARSGEEIAQARKDWEEGSRFGEVRGYDGARLSAPELPTTPLKPRGRVR